jgi:2-polyprenyl-3-methyl-5-hydroxy-6-metoxy-1,4-benzoquinol methylase
MKVNDIRPDKLLAGMHEAQQRDIEMLRSWRDKFVDIDCPVCAASKRHFLYEYNVMTHQRCTACGMQYVSPRPTPDLLAEFYALSANYAFWAKNIYPASEAIRREQIFAKRAQMVSALCLKRGVSAQKMLEVGVGYGLFIEELSKLNVFEQHVGVEPSTKLADICRAKGLAIINAPYEEIEPAADVDMIASFEVIEHLFSPATFATWVYAALKPDGLVIMTCPNIEGLDTLLLAQDSIAVDHQHLNYFSPRTFRMILEQAGFVDIEISTPGVLDVDLLRRAWREGKISDDKLGPFLFKIINEEDERTDVLLQKFLQSTCLSSNMMAVARKA